jgi:hypothetical protein
VAWWWEVEELLRRLLLTASVVLFDDGSPLQATAAVLISGWAHVLHAVYKPYGGGSHTYMLQHASLFVTSFVFLTGLLLKLQGLIRGSASYNALAAVLPLLCLSFLLWWGVAVVHSAVHACCLRRRGLQVPTKQWGAIGASTPAAGAPPASTVLQVADASPPSSSSFVVNPMISKKKGTERGLTSKLSSRPMRPRAAPGMASAPTGSDSAEPASAAADGGSADEAKSVVRRGSMADMSSEAVPGTVGGVVVASAGPRSVVGADGGGDDGGASRKTMAMASYFSAVRHKRPNGGSARATIVRNPAANAAIGGV